MSTHHFEVSGMSCSHCVGAVEQALKAADPRVQVRVELASGKVEVQSDEPRPVLVSAITGAGYTTQ